MGGKAMPFLSVLTYKVRAAVSGAVGALMFIIPAAPGPAGMLGGDGPGHHPATAVQPPASTQVVRSAGLFTIACTAAGWCTAGGNYQAAGRPIEPMVAAQSHGRWSRGVPLVLPAGAAAQPYAPVNGIACRSLGNCVVVGDYEYGRSHNLQGFIATESHGRWARAFTPRLPPDAASPLSALLEAVTCARDGSCTAVGSYQDSSRNAQTMVLAKPSSGPWRQATEIASPPGAASNPDAFMTGISCSAPGNCVAVGNYSVSPSRFEAMGAIESRGAWHRATEITVPRGAIASTFTAITSVSCLPTGPCLGVGQYAISATQSRAMVVTESAGRRVSASRSAAGATRRAIRWPCTWSGPAVSGGPRSSPRRPGPRPARGSCPPCPRCRAPAGRTAARPATTTTGSAPRTPRRPPRPDRPGAVPAAGAGRQVTATIWARTRRPSATSRRPSVPCGCRRRSVGEPGLKITWPCPAWCTGMCEWPNTTRPAPGNQRRSRAGRPLAWPESCTMATRRPLMSVSSRSGAPQAATSGPSLLPL